MKISLLIALFLLPLVSLFAQNISNGTVSGNFQLNGLIYNEDLQINAEQPNSIFGNNSFGNIKYRNGDFEAGLRYEAYLNTLLGFPNSSGINDGVGLAFAYAKFKNEDIEITLGNFYEQFGSGLILRTYEEKTLGYDNALQGVNIRYKPAKGVILKGLIGKQKYYFDLGSGIIRGLDTEFNFNELLPSMAESKSTFILAGGLVSKYQDEAETVYKLPENVSALSGRFNFSNSGFSLDGEYAYKINDPSIQNQYIYKEGQAFILNATYSQKGMGIFISAKRIDNFSFRSDRNASGNDLMINYIPDITKNHSYSFASMYPYVTQPNGEYAFAGEFSYNLKRNSLLGGKYGTQLILNFSQVNSIEKNLVDGVDDINNMSGTLGYTSSFFAVGDVKYYQDINITIQKKVSKAIKGTMSYQHTYYNDEVMQGSQTAFHGDLNAHIAIVDITYKLMSKHAIRLESQALFTKQDNGNWLMGIMEYTYSPNWFVALADQYNSGLTKKHYPKISFGYKKNSNNISLGYGRTRAGIDCTGGICRNVPASSGLTINLTSTF